MFWEIPTSPQFMGDIAALRAANTSPSLAYVTADLVGGFFEFNSGDYSVEVAADTLSAVYVAPDSDPTGATGVWIRQYEGRVYLEWGGFSENNTGAQNTAIMAAMCEVIVDGKQWSTTCNDGTFPLELFIWKNNYKFWGTGPNTIFINNNSLNPMQFGCMEGASFNVGENIRYALNSVTKGDATITCSVAGEGANFTINDTLVIFSDTGDTGSVLLPNFQQMTRIVNIVGDVIYLEEAIYKDTPAGANMLAIPGNALTGPNQVDAGIFQNVTCGNFAVSVDGNSWIRYGGTYKSTVGPIYVLESNTGISMNGFAYSTIHVVNASFKRYCIEVPVFCHNSTFKVDSWQQVPNSDNTNSEIIVATGGSHDNVIYGGNGFATDTSKTRDALITFSRCERTVVYPQDIGASLVSNIVGTVRPAASTMTYDTNKIIGGRLTATNCTNVINHAVTTAGEEHPLMILDGCKISCSNVSNKVINATASRCVLDCEINSPASAGITLNTSAYGHDWRRLKLINRPTSLSFGAACKVDKTGLFLGNNKQIEWIKGSVGSGSAITGVTTFVSKWSNTLLAGSLADDDVIHLVVCGITSGAAGTKGVQVQLNGSDIATASTAITGTNVPFFVFITIQMLTTSQQRVNMFGSFNGTVVNARGTAAIDITSTNLLIDIGGILSVGTDSMTIEEVTRTPKSALGY